MKSFIKAGFALSFLFTSLAGATPAQAAKYKVRWLIGHYNLDYFEEAARSFKASVEKGSHGDIEVQIIPAVNPWGNTSGRETPEIALQVAKGEGEMGHSFTNVMGELDHRLWAFDLPYLFTGYLHLEGVFEGPMGPQLLAGLRDHNLEGLAFTYSGGAQGVATLDHEIRGPGDLKGLKVGTFGSVVNNAWLSGLGATPVAIQNQLATIEEKMKDGGLDAAVLTWRRVHEAHLDSCFNNVSLMNSTYLVSVTYVNQKFMESLPAEYQALIRDSATTAARIERARTIELNEKTKREMTAKGVRPVYLSDKGRLEFQKALEPVYEKSLNAIVGKDLIGKIRKTPSALRHPSGLEVAGR